VILRLPDGALGAIARAAEAAYPEECCGVLVGRIEDDAAMVSRIAAAANVAAEAHHRFEIDPRDLLAAHREARTEGMAVIGHYHSHPGAAARPSGHDLARAREAGEMAAGEVWLIQPVGERKAGMPRAYVFDGAEFTQAEIVAGAAGEGR
jgi:proteasome lid subunit RPN8/RPN11